MATKPGGGEKEEKVEKAGTSKSTAKTLSSKTTSFEYAEMNLRHTGNPEKTTALVRRALRMGYDTVVINVDIGDPFPAHEEEQQADDNDEGPPAKRKKKKNKHKGGGGGQGGGGWQIPQPFLVDEEALPALQLNSLQMAGRKFRQYSRLTVTLSDPDMIHQFLHAPGLKAFDILALRPHNEAIFTTLSKKIEHYDIMTYDHSAEKVDWLYTKSKIVQQLASEGIGFELAYADALTDSSQRRQVFSHARTLLRATKGKNVVFASGATEVLELRAPVDVMNMMLLFGVQGRKARPHLSDYPRDVLLRAEAKKTLKGAMVVTDLKNIPTKTLSREAAIARLMGVPEFLVQIEKVEEKKVGGETGVGEAKEEKMEQ